MNQMNAKEPTRGSGYLFEDDFSDASFDAPKPTTPEEIRKNAHITSGGEQASSRVSSVAALA